ncbi:Prolyl 4-hydroxylase subunit alpha-1 [Parelaphostrongylus tenuis]|uniref:procollagen-proline 4-dioxygenase n=1 Tax=Parelaphostrongylus tenuis TaxID=148309 RepID=A0AAD5N0X7_PARTN|nr:Prolyl 4-hydroxylase subunit alpha-1 [Parelaphostrongylus tenuis]
MLIQTGTLFLVLVFVRADLFTSVADMQSLLDSEKNVPYMLYKYIESEHKRLEQLRDLAQEYQMRNEDSLVTGIKDISNPINAFLLIKRKIFDWKRIEQKMMLNNAESFIERMSNVNYGIRYPTEEDLTGAAIGLLRLQDTYRLDTGDLANGRIYSDQGNYTFDAGDCFEIARAAYNEGDYYHTILWMEEAKKRLEEESEPTADMRQVLEYLSYSMYKQGNLKHALKLIEQLYELDPNHPRAKGNIKWYEDLLAQEGVKKSDMRRAIGRPTNLRPASVLGNKERTIYEALCRNEVPVSEKDISKLYCYYKRDRPYLVYAPIKVEIKRFKPLALLFKNVISDEEIEMIQELAKPRLARATVHDAASGKLVTATYRISKSAWLKGWEHEVVERINQRIDMMTNLNVETAEELQIANYGIGGHYDPHFDHARKEETKSFDTLGTGNRIATVLFYMTQPLYGGGTVFTDVKSAIFPTKNDALFWYNLHKFGDGDPRTRHAACPVLVGVKWVSNKWIHERGNEFRRRCGLKMSDDERFVGDLGFGPEPRVAPNLSPDLSKNIFDTI